jgi:hypothetical protein
MHYRMTSRRRKPRGNTTPQHGEKQQPAPRAPNEREDSGDSQRGQQPAQDRVAQAAREDVERGLVDSDQEPVLDETYERVRGGEDPEGKFSP